MSFFPTTFLNAQTNWKSADLFHTQIHFWLARERCVKVNQSLMEKKCESGVWEIKVGGLRLFFFFFKLSYIFIYFYLFKSFCYSLSCLDAPTSHLRINSTLPYLNPFRSNICPSNVTCILADTPRLPCWEQEPHPRIG